MKTAISWLVAILAMLLSGCANVALNTEKLASIDSISVDPDVKMPDDVTYSTFVSRSGGVIPIVGMAVEASEREANRIPADMRLYLSQEKSAVGEIIRNEFISALQKDFRFNKKLSANGRARFVLQVYSYGLISKPFTQSELQAKLSIRVTLVDSTGDVLWSKAAYVLRDEEVPALLYEEYFKSRAVLHDSFKTASAVVFRKIVAR